jgi:hypothetical protein
LLSEVAAVEVRDPVEVAEAVVLIHLTVLCKDKTGAYRSDVGSYSLWAANGVPNQNAAMNTKQYQLLTVAAVAAAQHLEGHREGGAEEASEP